MNKTDELIKALPALNTTSSTDSDIVNKIVASQELAKNPEVVRKVTKYGKTPVIYAPTKAMWKSMYRVQDPGLLHFIANALTVDEVNNYLKLGKEKYHNASKKTIRKWDEAATKRIAELTAKK